MSSSVAYVKFAATGDCGSYLKYLLKSGSVTSYTTYGSSENKLYFFDTKSYPISGIRTSWCGVVRSKTDPAPTVASLIGTTTFTEQWYTSYSTTGYKSVSGSATEVTGYTYQHRIVYDDGAVARSGSSTIVDGVVMSGTIVAMTFNDSASYVYTLPSGSPYVSGRTVSIPADVAADVDVVVTRTPKFTVKFNANGGTGTMADQSFVYGVEQDLTRNAFTAPSLYAFDGWNTAADGSGTDYEDGADGSEITSTPGGSVTLYAQWRFVGFNLTATKTTGAGTLTLQKDGTTVATESSGTLTYTGAADGAVYQLVCTMADGYALPPMAVSPTEGASLSLVFANPLYFVSLPSEDASGNSFSVTTPAEPDGTVDGKDAYVAGRNVVVTADLGDEQMLTAAYLDDENHSNFATYTGESIAGGAFTITGIDRSCYVRGTFAARQYSVTCAADEASASALTVAASASSVTKNIQVTFTATPATGYSFEGWYLDGEPAPDSTVEEGGVSTTYHYNDPIYKCAIVSDIHLVAKAKIAVSLDVSEAAQLTIDGATVTVPYSADVTLGDSFSFLVEATAPDTYFLGWFAPGGDIPLPDYGSSGTVTPSAAINMTARFGDVDPTLPVMITVAYADGSDSTRGTFSIDGGTATTVQKTYRDTVVLEAIPKNGYLFAGWFLNAAGQGTPAATTPKVEMLATLSRTYYARFAQNDHSICEWEGSKTPKALVWRSKTYAASKPFNPSACRVDGLGYPPSKLVELTVDMFSAPDVNAKPTASTTLTNIADQDARRLPVRRMERYMQVQIKANVEIDTLLVGTSMEGIAL